MTIGEAQSIVAGSATFCRSILSTSFSPAVFDGVWRDMDENGLGKSTLLVRSGALSPILGANVHPT